MLFCAFGTGCKAAGITMARLLSGCFMQVLENRGLAAESDGVEQCCVLRGGMLHLSARASVLDGDGGDGEGTEG